MLNNPLIFTDNVLEQVSDRADGRADCQGVPNIQRLHDTAGTAQ